MAAREDSQRLTRLRLAARCPELRVGDVWEGVHGPAAVTVVAFEHIAGDDWPWPMVRVRFNESVTETWGAPAFMSANLLKRGDGLTWKPPRAEAA